MSQKESVWRGWLIEGMESDIEFELGQAQWARRMIRDFPRTPNLPYYSYVLADAELRLHQLRKKLNTFSCTK